MFMRLPSDAREPASAGTILAPGHPPRFLFRARFLSKRRARSASCRAPLESHYAMDELCLQILREARRLPEIDRDPLDIEPDQRTLLASIG